MMFPPVLRAGVAALALVTATPCVSAQVMIPQPTPNADALAAQMRLLAANPRDVTALVTAGELSTKLDDPAAALAFFDRAAAVEPNNPRIAAGRACTMVLLERPGEALRLFAQAEAGGVAMTPYLAQRGLAYDLIGQPGYAQRDYRAALKQAPDDETVRRLALSLGISGKREEAVRLLDPLLRRSDRAAWRAQAFVLALGGDLAGADRIAATSIPGGAALGPFFRRLPALSLADRAFAVHFGEMTSSPTRIADARLAPPLAVLPSEPAGQPVAVAARAIEPATTTREASRARSRDRSARARLGRDAAQVASVAPAPRRAASSPPPSPSAMMQTAAPPASVAAPPRVTPSVAPGRAEIATTPGTTPAPAPAPSQVAAVPVAAPAPTPAPAPVAQVATAVPATTPVPAATPWAMSADAAPVATARPRAAAPAADKGADAVVRASSPALAHMEVFDAPRRAVPRPAATPTPPSTPVAVRAPVAVPTPTQPPTPAPRRRAANEALLAAIVSGITVPESELEPVPGPARARTTVAAKAAAKPTARPAVAEDTPVASRKSAARALVASIDTKKPDTKQSDTDKAEPRKAEPKPKADPPRWWVQVAGGARASDLDKDWKRLTAKSSALKGKAAYVTPLRATNRLLTGPFKTEEEARAMVNRLAKDGASAFTFQSAAGQKVDKLDAP